MAQPEPSLLTADVVRRALLSGRGVTLMTLTFIASYAGALHSPKPHGIPLAVTTQVPAAVAGQLERSSALGTLFAWLAAGLIVALLAGRRAGAMTAGEADVAAVAAMAP